MKKSLSFRMKMLLICGFLSTISIVVGGYSYYSLTAVSKEYNKLADLAVPNIISINTMFAEFRQMRILLRTLGLQYTDKKLAEDQIAKIQEGIIIYKKLDQDYLAIPFLPGEEEVYSKMTKIWDEFQPLALEIIELYQSGKPEDYAKMQKLLVTKERDIARPYADAVKDVIKFHNDNAAEWTKSAQEKSKAALNMMMLVIGVGVFTGLGIAYLMASRISTIMNRVTQDLANGSEQVNSASQQIANSSISLSQSSTEQASSLEETVATIEELTSMVKMNSTNAREAANLSQNTRDIAVRGEQDINALVQSIQEISADSKKIEEIINVIDDIAFQTNLLALNAAVEAARAGEQGKGFAVVAEAVRTLAQRSSEAAKDIATLIKNSVDKIDNGNKKAVQGGQVLGEILTSVKKVSDLNNEIATASEEQSNGIMQIGKAMNQLDAVTQSNAAASEEAAAAAEELSAQSKVLKDNVEILFEVVEGSSAHGKHDTTATPVAEKAKSTFAKLKPGTKKTESVADNKAPEKEVKKAAPAAKVATVTELKPKSKSASSDVIPFDEDEPARKVGTTDGF